MGAKTQSMNARSNIGDIPVPCRDTAIAGEERRGWRMLAVLSVLMGFASISTDLYLPAMPAIGRALGADAGAMEWTVSGYLIGFSMGQLFWGPIGDRYGRKLPIAIGLVLFVIGSAGCAMADNIWSMIGWRVLQASGACAGVVLARAMVRDLYEGRRAAQMMSTLLTAMAIAPLFGPIIGGQILALAGWRATFWALVGIGFATLVALFTLPETLPPAGRQRAPLFDSLKSYVGLLRHRAFLSHAGAGALFYSGMFAYIAGTPAAYIGYYRVPADRYGLLFAIGVVGIMGGNFANSRLVARWGGSALLLRGAAVAALSGILLTATTAIGWGGLTGLVLPLFLFVSATGFIVANSISGALAGFPEQAGLASALVGAIQYGSGILGSAVAGVFADSTPRPMAWVIAASGIGCLACAMTLRRPGKL